MQGNSLIGCVEIILCVLFGTTGENLHPVVGFVLGTLARHLF